MKVFQLISSLYPAEKKEMSVVIQSTGRKSLENIFKLLVKSSAKRKIPDKQTLYFCAFGKSYNAKSDYVLRNELRLLSDIICAFIAEKEALLTVRENPSVQHKYLLRNWNTRNLTGLFHKHAEPWIAEAMEENYLDEAFDMYLLALDRVMYDFEDSPEKLQKLLRLVNGCTQCVEKLFTYKWWSTESHYQAIHNYKNVAAGKSVPVPPRKPDAHAWQSFPNDDLVLAMQYENSIYAAKREAYLSILQKAYAHCKKIMDNSGRGIYQTCKINPVKFYSVLNERIMIIMCAEGNAENAGEYVNELERLVREKKVKLNHTLNYNISYYYFFCGEYSKVIENADGLLKELHAHKRLYYQALCMKAYCYLYLNQFTQVRPCIPAEVQQVNLDEYVQFRMAEMILWYAEDAPDAALRECDNIRRMLKRKPESERNRCVIDFTGLNGLYKMFFEAAVSPAGSRRNLLQKSKCAIEKFRNSCPVVFRQTPALHWLYREISGI